MRQGVYMDHDPFTDPFVSIFGDMMGPMFDRIQRDSYGVPLACPCKDVRELAAWFRAFGFAAGRGRVRP